VRKSSGNAHSWLCRQCPCCSRTQCLVVLAALTLGPTPAHHRVPTLTPARELTLVMMTTDLRQLASLHASHKLMVSTQFSQFQQLVSRHTLASRTCNRQTSCDVILTKKMGMTDMFTHFTASLLHTAPVR